MHCTQCTVYSICYKGPFAKFECKASFNFGFSWARMGQRGAEGPEGGGRSGGGGGDES